MRILITCGACFIGSNLVRSVRAELGWAPQGDVQSDLRQTVRWYLDHPAWTQAILDGSYRLELLGRG